MKGLVSNRPKNQTYNLRKNKQTNKETKTEQIKNTLGCYSSLCDKASFSMEKPDLYLTTMQLTNIQQHAILKYVS